MAIPAAQGAYGAQANPYSSYSSAKQKIKETYGYDASDDEVRQLASSIGWDPTQGAPSGAQLESAHKAISQKVAPGGGGQPGAPGTPQVPPGYVPSVNRDGSIPNPAAPSATTSGFAGMVSSKLNAPPAQLPTTDLPTYRPASFQDPTDPTTKSALTSLVNAILQNPESLSPAVVAAMKEAQKEQALSTHSQLTNELAQGAASRGTFGGGNMQANQRRAADVTSANITKGARDIDIAAAAQNMADRRAAATLGDQFASSGVNRGLATAGFNADEQRAAHQSEVARVNFALQRALSQAGLDQGSLDSALRAWQVGTTSDLGHAGLALDRERLVQQAQQFAQAHGLDWIRVLNDMVMGRANYGLDLAGLQQKGQSDLMNWLFPNGF